MSKTILITGASSGFGKLTVLALQSSGHQVIATMRDIAGRNQSTAQELSVAGAIPVELDVTNDESVDTAFTHALKKVERIDVIVNNAGVGVTGHQEAFTVDDFMTLFDINVFGVQRVLRAAIPHLRANQSGVIINVSSLLGRFTIPYYGPYNASKWALEALTENYRTELSQFGIEVCLVEPGGFATDFLSKLIPPGDSSRNEHYAGITPTPTEFLHNFEAALAANPVQDPANVANAILKLVNCTHGERKFRTIVDSMGMGDHLEGYNESIEQITHGIYGAFGIDHLLSLKE